MSSQILISIIIPCYNLGEFLPPCLASIEPHIRDEVEFIFVDDGSTDTTPSLLDSFCSNHRHCVVIHQENSGVSCARNTALNHCRGEYIYLLDGDDLLSENSIDSMINVINSESPDVIISPILLKRDEKISKVSIGIPTGIYSPTDLYANCNLFPTKSKLLYRRRIIEKNSIEFDSNLPVGEVYDFTIRFLNYANKVSVVSECFAIIVVRYSSAARWPNFMKDLVILSALRQYYIHGSKFVSYPSFNNTAFKILMSFTYNKYAKLKLRDDKVYDTIRTILSDPLAIECIDRVVKSPNKPLAQWLFALYVKTTGVLGYKLLTSLIVRVQI